MKRILFFLFLLGCSSTRELNLKPHRFNQEPAYVVWLQAPRVRALDILRHEKSSEPWGESSLEKFHCSSDVINSTIYQKSPSYQISLNAQINGSLKSNGSCSDHELNLWDLFFRIGVPSFLLDGESRNNYYEITKKCSNLERKYSLFSRNKVPREVGKPDFFHESLPWEESPLSFDRSCQKGKCQSDFFELAKKMVFHNITKKEKSFTLLRYYKTLSPEQVKSFGAFIESVKKLARQRDVLFLMSTDLSNNDGVGKVLATGDKSENFCGVYHQTDLLRRILRAKNNSLGKKLKKLLGS